MTAGPPTVTNRRGSDGPAEGAVLDRRALNRALLARQLLLERASLTAAEAVEHLVGMQGQAPTPPHVGLWARLAGFRHGELDGLLDDRGAVRLALQRGTVHLVTARDCLALRPVVQPFYDRWLAGAYGKAMAGVDLAEVAAVGRALVEERPRTPAELGKLLAARWPGHDTGALNNVVRALVPLVQLPPRGHWNTGKATTLTTAEAWLGRPLDPDPDPAALVRRYLAAFGPATAADVTVWSGLTGLGEVVERLRPTLRTFRDERGRELLDVPGAPLPDPDAPAPARLLPEFDNLVLSHADRTRVVDDPLRPRLMTKNGIVHASFLVDGFVAGTWKLDRTRRAATVTFRPFAALRDADRDELVGEAARLLGLATAEGSSRDVRFADPG